MVGDWKYYQPAFLRLLTVFILMGSVVRGQVAIETLDFRKRIRWFKWHGDCWSRG